MINVDKKSIAAVTTTNRLEKIIIEPATQINTNTKSNGSTISKIFGI